MCGLSYRTEMSAFFCVILLFNICTSRVRAGGRRDEDAAISSSVFCIGLMSEVFALLRMFLYIGYTYEYG